MDTAPDTIEAPECGFVGNPEIYGIGIRLGFYTQALAAWFANYFIASEARVLRPANLLYILVLEIVMVIYAATPEEGWEEGGVYAIEVFVMLTILFAIGFVTISDSQPRYSRRYLAATPAYTSSFQLLAVLALVFGNWFWWHGIDLYKPTPCRTSVWVFVHVDLYGWLRKLGQAVNVYLLIWYGVEFLQSVPILFKRLFIRAPIRQFMDPGPQNSFFERCKIKWAEAIGGERLRQESDLPAPTGVADTPLRPTINSGFVSRQREKLGRFVKGRIVKISWRRLEHSEAPSLEQSKAFERVREAEDFLDCVVGESLNLAREELLTTAIRETYWHFLSDLFRVGKKVIENYLMTRRRKQRQDPLHRVESDNFRSFMRFNPALQYFISVAAVFEEFRAPKTPATRSGGKGGGRRRRDIPGTIQLVHSVQQHARMRRVDILLLNYVTQQTLTTPKPQIDDLWKWVELASQAQYSRQSLKTRDGLIMSPETPGVQRSKDFSKKLKDGWKIAATVDIVILILLIAQIETTLVWNNVKDINVIKSFGQLLGFFVGVSGLFTVVYRKTSDEIHNIRQASKKPEKTPFDEAVTKYVHWKKTSTRGAGPSQGLHAAKTEPLPLDRPASQARPSTAGRRETKPQRPSISTTASTQAGVAPHD